MTPNNFRKLIIGVLAFFVLMTLIGKAIGPASQGTVSAAASTTIQSPANDTRNLSDIAQPRLTPPSRVAVTPTTEPSPAGDVRYPDTPDYISPADHPGMTRDEQIKALMREDPSSYGYTDADREFLREHGVTEAQARAIEESMARGN